MELTPEQQAALNALRVSDNYFDLNLNFEPRKGFLDGDFTSAELRLLADALDCGEIAFSYRPDGTTRKS